MKTGLWYFFSKSGLVSVQTKNPFQDIKFHELIAFRLQKLRLNLF